MVKLFSINDKGTFVEFSECKFKLDNNEDDLQRLLENNPEYFFDDKKILIIGKEVITNLNSYIDLLGVDDEGNTVVIELKREKTPRDTIAQLLEYASYVDNLNYEQLNEIFKEYLDEDIELDSYHLEYFEESEKNVSWNKSSKLIIVAQTVIESLRQTSMYLRNKGIDIYCLEFKYFENDTKTRMISSDFVVGEGSSPQKKLRKTPQTKIDRQSFENSLDDIGKETFRRIFDFIENQNLQIYWGSKGLSLNVKFENNNVAFFFGYPPNSVFNQSIFFDFMIIEKKVKNSQKIRDEFDEFLGKLKIKISKKPKSYKYLIDKETTEEDINNLQKCIEFLVEKIKLNGLNLEFED